MPLNVALKISTSGGDVDFYEDEVLSVRFSRIQDLQLQERQTKNPVIFSYGDQYNVLELRLSEERLGTIERMNDLIDIDEEVEIFYRYNWAATDSIMAIPMIDDDQEIRHYGHKSANNGMTVRFLKSA